VPLKTRPPHDKVLSGDLPYAGGRESVAAYNIVSGVRPPRPRTATADRWLPDPIWDVIRRCWNQAPRFRLTTELLYQEFAKSAPEHERGTPVAENREGELWFPEELIFETHFQTQGRWVPGTNRPHHQRKKNQQGVRSPRLTLPATAQGLPPHHRVNPTGSRDLSPRSVSTSRHRCFTTLGRMRRAASPNLFRVTNSAADALIMTSLFRHQQGGPTFACGGSSSIICLFNVGSSR